MVRLSILLLLLPSPSFTLNSPSLSLFLLSILQFFQFIPPKRSINSAQFSGGHLVKREILSFSHVGRGGVLQFHQEAILLDPFLTTFTSLLRAPVFSLLKVFINTKRNITGGNIQTSRISETNNRTAGGNRHNHRIPISQKRESTQCDELTDPVAQGIA